MGPFGRSVFESCRERMRRVTGVVMACAFWSIPAVGGAAELQGTLKSTHEDWQVRCETPAGARKEQCALMQIAQDQDRPSVVLSVLVIKTADQKSRLMRVLAPLGVLLPSGLALKVDETDVGRAPFTRCLPNGCVADIVLDDPLVQQLKAGKDATFIIFQTPEEGIGIPFSLKGFGGGFEALPNQGR